MNWISHEHEITYAYLSDLFKKYKIPVSLMTKEGQHNREVSSRSGLTFASAVLQKLGFTPTEIRWIVRGIPGEKFKCEYEMTGGWGSMYLYAVVETVINTYIRYKFEHDYRFEVGFDLSQIDPEKLKERYDLSGQPEVVETALSVYMRETYPKDRNEANLWLLWRDKAGNTFSFKNSMADFYYQGYVFINKEEAFKFVKWAISQPDFYIKEIDFIRNSFGGLAIHDLDAYEKRNSVETVVK